MTRSNGRLFGLGEQWLRKARRQSGRIGIVSDVWPSGEGVTGWGPHRDEGL